MFDYDKWQEIFGTIRKNKLRTFLTALGVFWGIFMLVVLMGAGTGLRNGVYAMFGSISTKSGFLGVQPTTMPYQGLPSGRVPKLTLTDIRQLEDEFPAAIDIAAPLMWMGNVEIARNGVKRAISLEGHVPEMIHIDDRKMVEGRFLNEQDMQETRKVIVIGERARDQLFKPEEAVIGERVNIWNSAYQIVGVFAIDGGSGNNDDASNMILVPLTTTQKITNRPDEVSMLMFTVTDNYKVAGLEDKIIGFLKQRLKVHPDDPRGFWFNNLEAEFESVVNLFTGIRMLIWFVGIGSLLFGILGVGNIMLIVVKDRTKEIGIRKALGATPASIISMILLESAFITTVAGYFGLVFSIGIVAAMKMAVGEGVEMFSNPQIDLSVAIGATLVLIIAGTLTGLYPALQAASISPVEALKTE